jgi:glycosyl transferase family 2
MPSPLPTTTYLLPLRTESPLVDDEFTGYLRWLSDRLEVMVVDGSPAEVFAAHQRVWGSLVHHVPLRSRTLNGKVAGVVEGVATASTSFVVIADDDVRYDDEALSRVTARLAAYDAVMPQNHFDPSPWHARWDTARSLLNRAAGHDFAGTVAVRRAALVTTGGYCGAVLFENLELLRTLAARGFRCHHAPDIFVVRRPPALQHFLRQRVRQAYDSRAQPWRWLVELAIVPMLALLVALHPVLLVIAVLAVVAVAEMGRRRHRGRTVYPPLAGWWAPCWVAERGVCSWLALALALRGGVTYRGSRLRTAAHSLSALTGQGCPERSCTCDTALRQTTVRA